MENRIVWLKWVDPLGHLVKDDDDDDDDEGLEYQASHDSFIEEEANVYRPNQPNQGNTGPMLMGPMGPIPIREDNLPGRIFNFWMGHCNFGITYEVAKKIAEVPGVETLDIFTRYRFRIAVGKSFNQTQVKSDINVAVCPVVKQQSTQPSTVGHLANFLSKKYKFWAICTMPSGSYEMTGGNTIEEVQTKMKNFEERAVETVKSWEALGAT